MKFLNFVRIAVVFLFALLILAPVGAFRFEGGAVSEIDNRTLAPNPFSPEAAGTLRENIESYVNDRIGFRDEMILAYTLLHDRLFHLMIHPNYVYGKENYVFSRLVTRPVTYREYHTLFADMVGNISDFCRARGVPFLFVVEPTKESVLTEFVPEGVNYSRAWIEPFFARLEERGVEYLDNREILLQKTREGEAVFNRQYDAIHWNDLGAYYGTNEMLKKLKEKLPEVHVNRPEELHFSEEKRTSLQVSRFPIDETVPIITVAAAAAEERTDEFSALKLHPEDNIFRYYTNPERLKEGAPRALVFQGSHMNGIGYKFLCNGFGEYIMVHNYHNVTDFSYYYDLFQPDCVIFEVAEAYIYQDYFTEEEIASMVFPPVLELSSLENADFLPLSPGELTAETHGAITEIVWQSKTPAEFAWLCLEQPYDMKKTESGFSVSVLTDPWERYREELSLATLLGDSYTVYR